MQSFDKQWNSFISEGLSVKAINDEGGPSGSKAI